VRNGAAEARGSGNVQRAWAWSRGRFFVDPRSMTVFLDDNTNRIESRIVQLYDASVECRRIERAAQCIAMFTRVTYFIRSHFDTAVHKSTRTHRSPPPLLCIFSPLLSSEDVRHCTYTADRVVAVQTSTSCPRLCGQHAPELDPRKASTISAAAETPLRTGSAVMPAAVIQGCVRRQHLQGQHFCPRRLFDVVDSPR